MAFLRAPGNVYVQLETHIETQQIEACKNRQYSFDDSLSLLRVTPDGQTEWRKFQHVHADGDGEFVVQPRVFAGESIPEFIAVEDGAPNGQGALIKFTAK